MPLRRMINFLRCMYTIFCMLLYAASFYRDHGGSDDELPFISVRGTVDTEDTIVIEDSTDSTVVSTLKVFA